MQFLSSNTDQWSQDLVRLPDHALTQLHRENSMLAKAISRELKRRADLMKYRKFRLRCIIPAFLDRFISDDDDSPGEFADAIESGLIKLTTAISTCQDKINITLVRFALLQLRKPFRKRAFSQTLVVGSATVTID